MPLKIIWEEAGVIRQFYGTVSTEDIQSSVDRVHADTRFPTLRYSINDFLGVTAVDVSKATLANAALRTIGDSANNASVMVAIVATQPEVLALAEFYASPTYLPYQAKVFSSVAQAREWIEPL